MKNHFYLVLSLVLLLLGCQRDEVDSIAQVQTKEVVLTTSFDVPEGRASLDSTTGAFTWQSGDLISVLATDGNFYDFILTSGAGERTAEFIGSIPVDAQVTSVATYPRVATNGTANTLYSDGTLNYVLPDSWTYAKDVSNVPMVAAFDQGANHMAFKQVGGVMRFPVQNLPVEATVEIVMHDKTITGLFPIDVTALGESCMVAGSSATTLTINYSSDVDGANAEFNVPVPTGTYDNFTLNIKDGEDEVIYTKNYSAENKVERATLMNMSPIVLDERAMAISEVWPFFVDARVVFNKYEGVTKYAFYVDNATTPVILDAEDLGDSYAGLIGGEFDHNSTHTVAVAKVVDDVVIEDSKSQAVEFTTGRIMQMTRNTGTRFICAGWDDVAIGKENSSVYDEATGKWSMVPMVETISARPMRGYRVMLYAEDKETILYDEITFNGQADYGGTIANSSWLGKKNGKNVLIPTSLSFGWLEPNTKYYFRVKTLDSPVVFDSPETGCFEPDTEGYTLYSARGGSGWSDFVEMTTDAIHVPSENEIFYEGFDDMFYNSDIMNAAPAVVPQILTTATSEDNYKKRASADLYKTWVAQPFEEREFSAQGFANPLHAYFLGLSDDKYSSGTPRYLNEYAGSLEGWAVRGAGSETRGLYPNFGAVRIGQSANATGYVELRTPPIYSDKLSDDKDTRCLVTVKVSSSTTDKEKPVEVIGFYHYRGDVTMDNTNTVYFVREEDKVTYKPEWTENYMWTDEDNYTHYPTWFEVTTEMSLRNGDIIGFDKPNVKEGGEDNIYRGFMVIGEVTIEVIPETSSFVDDGVGTAPDDTNYDVYGLGEMPISYWYTVEPSSYIDIIDNQPVYNYEKTKARYQQVKDAGINVALYYGHSIDRSIQENIRIHDICEELGLKFIGATSAADNATRIQQIKDAFGDSDTYIGELLWDEPSVARYDEMAEFVDAYNAALPTKDAYVNLFPQYAKVATQLGAEYEDYIDQYLAKVQTKNISYDFYGLLANGSLNAMYYSNLDVMRSKTLAERMPFWVITQSGQVNSCRMPNEVEQRWSVWSTLAGGSKGIAYFCYWTPSGTSYEATPYMIDLNGDTTEMYNWVKKINADINTIGKKLLYCHADGAISTSTTYLPLYDNGGAGRTKYGPIKAVKAVNEHTFLGCFRDARISESGDNYKGYKALITPRTPNVDITSRLTLDTSVTKITFTYNNTIQEVNLVNNMNTSVGAVSMSYLDGQLTLNIPKGDAILLEF